MKKVLGIATALMVLFAFTVNVGAQVAVVDSTNVTDITDHPANSCPYCNKSAVGNVPTPQVTSQAGLQGAVIYDTTNVCPFDYDDNDSASEFNGVDVDGNRWGYCPSSAVGALGTEYDALGEPIAQRNVKFMINVCDCPESCNLDVGTKIGIQMTILTPGVYWAHDPKTLDAAGNYTVRFMNYGKQPGPQAGVCPTGEGDLTKDFGTVTYYERMAAPDALNVKGLLQRTPINPGTPLAGCANTNVPAGNRVQVLQSDMLTDYVVQPNDSDLCWFWIDIPAMRLDSTAQVGDAIQVRVSLLWDRELEGICSDCKPPVICECIRTVAIVGCEAPNMDKGCLFFPYLVQGTEDSDGWVAGVGISAMGDTLPGDAWVELTLKDTAGNVATWRNADMGNQLVWAFVLDRIMDNFDGTLVPGVVSLQVDSNYALDGYGFLMNQTWQLGAGQLPRTAGGFVCAP